MQTIISYLKALKQNNTRDWFNANKELYNAAKDKFESYVNILIPLIKEFDETINVNSAKECMFRIYRDVRFSKNKEPYKTNFGAYIAKDGRKSKHAGYYIHVEPNASFAGGGIYMPQAKELKAIRDAIFNNPEELKEIINNKKFKEIFPEIYGEKLKTAPRGFPKDFKDIELLRHKSYAVVHYLEDEKLLSSEVFGNIIDIFKIQHSFNKYLNKQL